MTAADATAVHGQVNQLRNPDTGGIKQVEHGVVAQDERGGFFRQGQHLVHLGNGQGMGQAAADFGRINISNGVGGQLVLADKKIKKGALGGKTPGIAAGADAALKTVLEKETDMFAGDLFRLCNAAFCKKLDEKTKVGAVTVDRIYGKAALNRKVLQKEIKAVA
jgi:hypothetical protein